MSENCSLQYKILTDAASDLTDSLVADYPDVQVLPMEVMVGGVSYNYGPGGNLSSQEFYRLLKQGNKPSTSQINPSCYLIEFTKILELGYDILYLGFSSGLSGMYQNAKMTAEILSEQYPHRKIRCVDTLCAAPGEGFLVLEAAKKKREGFSLDDLADWVELHRLQVCHWFMVDGLSYLHQGGRVSTASVVAGTALQIKPLLRLNNEGKLEVAGKPRGNKRALLELITKMREQWNPRISKSVAIVYSGAPEQVQSLCDTVISQFPDAICYTASVGPVIGAHTGPGLLALVYWGNQR